MNATKSRKPLQALHVEARWLQRPAPDCPGLLSIETEPGVGQCYAVATIKDEAGVTLGYGLMKNGGETYAIPTDLSSCECKDFLYRGQYRPVGSQGGGCKHIVGLRVGLAVLAAHDEWDEAETRWQPTAAARAADLIDLSVQPGPKCRCRSLADHLANCEQWPGFGEHDDAA